LRYASNFQPTAKLPEDTPMLRPYIALVKEFLLEDDGPTAVEYAVMLALIIVSCLAAVTIIGKKANQTFLTVGSSLTTSS
jgi:pilus assembly protein Flp/PilA